MEGMEEELEVDSHTIMWHKERGGGEEGEGGGGGEGRERGEEGRG